MKNLKISDAVDIHDINTTTVEVLSDPIMFYWHIVRITSGHNNKEVYCLLNKWQLNNWIKICRKQKV